MEKIKVQELTIDGTVYVPKDSTTTTTKVVEINGEESLWEIGKNYLIRTVTMIQIGKLERITDKELLLSSACWVADTGRFSTSLEKGTLNEVEMFKSNVIVNRGSIIDATEWTHLLPTITK